MLAASAIQSKVIAISFLQRAAIVTFIPPVWRAAAILLRPTALVQPFSQQGCIAPFRNGPLAPESEIFSPFKAGLALPLLIDILLLMRPLIYALSFLLWTAPAFATGTIEVFFSPHGGCTEAVVSNIAQAKTSVFVQAYSFTSAPIAKALVDAHKRGVKVQVILDKSQKTQRYSSADFLANAGIKPLIDSKHAIAHNKIMIIDQRVVLTGSFNFTKAAEESNAENLLVIHDPELAAVYKANWEDHSQHSQLYRGRSQ